MKKSFTPLEIRKHNGRRKFLTGFTLIELIVVIAIIAILAAIIAPNAFKAIEKAKISKAIAEVDTVKTAALSYYADTGKWPPNFDSMYELVNGFLFDDDGSGNFVSGWDGPYVEKWSPHPWGGHLSWACDLTSGSGCFVYLNDDRPNTSNNDNGGKIPEAAMLRIDEIVDDGDLTTGDVRETVAAGELSFTVIKFN